MNFYGLKSFAGYLNWRADSEGEATLLYINDVLNGDFDSLYEAVGAYNDYCKDVGIDNSIYWTKL